jgi:hypothetical protein
MVSKTRVGESYIKRHDQPHPSWWCLHEFADFEVVLAVVNGLHQKKC